LNELSRAIGAKTENAWLNWLYLDDRGQDLFCMPEGKGAGVWGLR
jgi:hypothetical protein